jgi:mono/diheme cytochrome c family protein
MSRTGRRIVFVALGLAGLLIAGSALVYQREVRAELAPVGRGEQLAAAAGCFACHGRSDADFRANFRRTPSGDWRDKPVPTFWENGIEEVDTLVEWITHGHPAAERERHQQLFMQMPAYERVLAPEDREAIAAWILAHGLHLAWAADPTRGAGAVEEEPTDEAALWREGDRLSRMHGCYQCHGELGQGGVPNLASFKGYIPGFFGGDFRALTADGDREEVRYWIEHGRGRAIEGGALGRLATRYFDRQAIGMPAYEGRLTERDLTVLVDYLLLLNARGPLSARDVEHLARQLMQ